MKKLLFIITLGLSSLSLHSNQGNELKKAIESRNVPAMIKLYIESPYLISKRKGNMLVQRERTSRGSLTFLRYAQELATLNTAEDYSKIVDYLTLWESNWGYHKSFNKDLFKNSCERAKTRIMQADEGISCPHVEEVNTKLDRDIIEGNLYNLYGALLAHPSVLPKDSHLALANTLYLKTKKSIENIKLKIAQCSKEEKKKKLGVRREEMENLSNNRAVVLNFLTQWWAGKIDNTLSADAIVNNVVQKKNPSNFDDLPSAKRSKQ